jgi:hypothetical protein
MTLSTIVFDFEKSICKSKVSPFLGLKFMFVGKGKEHSFIVDFKDQSY